MTSTAIERRAENNGRTVAIFEGSSADEILAVASDVATKFSDVVRKQRMFKRIGDNDHIQIEAWQTIGALTGVLADEGEVAELAWPHIEPLGEEPPLPGREPRNRDSDDWRVWKRADKLHSAWELHDDLLRARALGHAFGFKAAFRSAKNGSPAGWGEGRCARNEPGKVNQEDYALSSMAQTRAQSRALGAPLKFVVKLAGYETTPLEELDGHSPAANTEALEAAQAAAQKMAERIAKLDAELIAAREALGKGGSAPSRTYRTKDGDASWDEEASDEQMNQAANLVRAVAHPYELDGEQFIVAMGQHLNGVPVVCVTMLRGLARFIGDVRAKGEPENAPPPPSQSAYHSPPDPPDRGETGHIYHGD